MRFEPMLIRHPDTGAVASVYVPVALESYQPPNETTVEYEIGGVARRLLSSVVDMVVRFDKDRARREKLGQDCAAFALACATNRSLYDTDFTPGKNTIKAYYRDRQKLPFSGDNPLEPELQPGEVLYLAAAELSGLHDSNKEGQHHFAIRASVGEKRDPLYASKFGTDGVACLHTLYGISAYYSIGSVVQVDRFVIVPATHRKAKSRKR